MVGFDLAGATKNFGDLGAQGSDPFAPAAVPKTSFGKPELIVRNNSSCVPQVITDAMTYIVHKFGIERNVFDVMETISYRNEADLTEINKNRDNVIEDCFAKKNLQPVSLSALKNGDENTKKLGKELVGLLKPYKAEKTQLGVPAGFVHVAKILV